MSIHHNCPRCKSQVSEERLRMSPFVCNHCAFTISKPSLIPVHSAEDSDSNVMMIIAGSIVAIFILMASSVELRWLQARDFVGLSSISSLERMVKVCTELNNNRCVERALARQAKMKPERSVAHAEFLLGRKKTKEAVAAMKKHITQGKANADAYNMYARVLAENGQIDEATQYFERVTNVKKPKVAHQHDYVKYLTRAKRFDQALLVIMRARRTKPHAFAMEYRVISEMRSAVGSRVVAGKR